MACIFILIFFGFYFSFKKFSKETVSNRVMQRRAAFRDVAEVLNLLALLVKKKAGAMVLGS